MSSVTKADLVEWIEQCSGAGSTWYVKRLSGNDTLANGSHQAGPYIPKNVLFQAFPDLYQPDVQNPDIRFEMIIDSHSDRRLIRAIWYNNRSRGGTRNESRLTGFGGASSALLDPNNTGALVIFAFVPAGEATVCRTWICRNESDETIVEDRIGPVEPGSGIEIRPHPSEKLQLSFLSSQHFGDCHLQPHELPPDWLEQFPKGADIVRKTVEMRPEYNRPPDLRLLRRRECEFQLFLSIEEAIELPILMRGYRSVEEFTNHANTVMQRRKARSGRSLELHAKEIFGEEGLEEGRDFSHQPRTEAGKRPDFVFPSQAYYEDPSFPTDRLRMLAVKTTCKDRWRQILNEADRIPRKHLLTLQEGVSEPQFREMTAAGVQLVVPDPLIRKFPRQLQSEIQTFKSFIKEVSRNDKD